MVDVRSITRRQQAFTLPTVVIVSVVMLALLATAMQLVSTTSRSLQDQYYQSLAREAAEVGLVMAEDCGSGWTQPLRPGSGCSGSASQGSSANSYVVGTDNLRTAFAVSVPSEDGGLQSVGTVELLRDGTGEVWQSYTQDIRQQRSPSRDLTW